MRQALLLIPLSILAFLAVYSGDACGSGFREGGFPGCVREIGREFGALRESATSASSSPSFGDTGRAITARPTAGAPVTGGTASGPTESWRQVTFWSGRASKDTEPFLVARPAWRITWSAKGGPSSAAVSLRVAVYDSADEAPLVVVDADQPGSDTVDVAKGPGRYRLKLESANADWTV